MLPARLARHSCCLFSQASCSNFVQQKRDISALPALKLYSLRRHLAERLSNKHNEKRVREVGPDLACLEWLMNCGATKVLMSDSQVITSIRQMKEYLPHARNSKEEPTELLSGDLAYEKQWPDAPRVHIVEVDASDSAIANEGFTYFRDVRRLKTLKLNFCDFFGDEALRFLAMGRPAQTLEEIEIVLNPCVTDGAVYWLQRLKALKRAHFYFLPYVANRQAFLRQLRIALPRSNVSFPEVEEVGFGYEEKKK
ncbi:unnamed protein product [Caenorhabditis auriculariae]|uniref:ATP synthase subunit s, mitochondrial n=1 Tax=Caenorhabditis auriculariae TaxID=2777116 RepID=A0A8S1HP10_9PELO|nr:unnamed protein product [Caenorhabditis auriculariae]